MFALITIAVGNDAAIDMNIEYDSEIGVFDQRFDMLRSIRSLQYKIQTPLKTQHVEGQHEQHIPFLQLALCTFIA